MAQEMEQGRPVVRRAAPPAPTRYDELHAANQANAEHLSLPATPAQPPLAVVRGAEGAEGAEGAAGEALTVAALKERLRSADAAEVERLAAAEDARAGGPRTSAVEALDARRTELASR